MGTDKRERQKANREARLAAEAAAEARKRQFRFLRNAVILVIVIIAVGFLLAGCSSNDDASDTTVLKPTPSTCAPAKHPSTPKIDFDAAPDTCIDAKKTYTATIETTEGTVVVELDTKKTPITTNNFVELARWGYYDGTQLFRTETTTGIIQGGSPHTQSGSDPGPGYTIPDEALPFTAEDYGPGTLAMARTAAPDSASAQFFFLANEGGSYLGDAAQIGDSAGSYVVFGKTKEGLDVLQKIAALDDGTSAPSKPVSITKVTITES